MEIWRKISLRVRIYVILIALVMITMAGGIVTVWYTYQMEHLLTAVTVKDLSAFQTAEALVVALANQKGFVSYYFIEGDPEWLRQLGEYRQIFKELLNNALQLAETDREKNAISRIKDQYSHYIAVKDRVIGFYQEGRRETGTVLHGQARDLFFTVLKLCEKYKDIHKERIVQTKSASQDQAARLRFIAATAVSISFCWVCSSHLCWGIRF